MPQLDVHQLLTFMQGCQIHLYQALPQKLVVAFITPSATD